MKVLAIGCGHIGSVAAEDVARSMSTVEVFIADKDENRAKEVAERIDMDNVSYIKLDASNHTELVDTLREFDLAMGFLPGNLGYSLVNACIVAGKNLVDVSYMPENPLMLDSKSKEEGITIVPDCGLAPGISNVVVGHAISKLEKVSNIHIMVGGLPEEPVPPLGYVITWSPENLIDEYTRKTRIVRNGNIVEVETLSGLEEVDFPNVGVLEAFYTDGLRTLLYTVNEVDDMWEKTLRYPKHVEKIKLLKSLGLFSEEHISVDDVTVSPRRFTVKLFEQKLKKPEVEDIVAMKIQVSGIKNNKQMHHLYHLLDRYDRTQKITAMARTTAYPASIVAQLILRNVINEKGIIPLERLGSNEKFFTVYLDELKNRGIHVIHEAKG